MTAGRVKSVQWRILFRLVPLLALIFIGFLLWLGNHLKDVLYSANLELARRANLAVVYAIEATMLTDPDHNVWDEIGETVPRQDKTEVEVINNGGRVLFSTIPANKEVVHELGDAPCNICHLSESLRPTVDTSVVRDPGVEDYQVFATPLRNRDQCHGCHDKADRNLGVVLVRQSLEPIDEQVRTVQLASAAVGGIVLLLTMLTTRLLLGRYLNRPLRRLVAGARAIGAGNLEHTIELPEHTELAVLADTLNQSTVRLSRLQHELVENERLAAIGQTVAGLSHTLKNVLNGLRAGQYVLDRAREKEDAEKLRTGLRVTKSSVRRVERLIFDMLYYVKERVPRREPIDPNDIIQEVVDEMSDMAEGLEVDLRAETDPEIGQVALDRTSIYRALVDLVTNAVDACTESETGDLVILRSRATQDEIVLTVEDNGIGMSDEVLANLYTRFYSTKAAGGTGLGLHVVKKIAEEHGGSITVDSVPGKGSAFHIHLPRTFEDANEDVRRATN
jgi:signal transduction histidine kinase